MRRSLIQALLLGCAVFGLTPAHAEEAQPWTERAEALAHHIQADNLIVTDHVRAARAQEAARASGRTRLHILYDLAAEDFVGSAGDRVARSMPAFEREAAAQHDARYVRMALVLRAYAPALDGDYVSARRNLETALRGETDPFVRAAGERFRSYALTDLGLVGNALEAARSGLAHLPDDAAAATLRSGLYDALSYVSIRIGDVESGFEHMQRSVEIDVAAGKPIDGITVVYNVSSMLADYDLTDAALRIAAMDQDIAQRSGASGDRFFASLLCAKVNFAARHYAQTVRCAETGRAIVGAPSEYITRVLVLRARALARLGQPRQARQALTELRAIAATRGDPALLDKIASIEPEVLRAEGRLAEAFDAMRDYHEHAERTVLRRFNAGVKELRATLENEITRADERTAQQAIRSELQNNAMRGMSLAMLLGGACLGAAILIAMLIYRSRRNMLAAVGRAEEILASRVGQARDASESAASSSPTERLGNILDEIERRDVELKRAFEALEAARAAAEDANLAKSQFLTTMSHELRTPLNAIIGYSEMLLETEEQDSAHADLSRIRGAGLRLLLMVNDLLDLSKIEAGRMETHMDAVDLDVMLDDIVGTVSPAAETGGNQIIAAFERPLGLAQTDSFKLSQCLLNLMSNALKFTKDGRVTLRARRECVNGADWLSFEVIDTGVGISQEAQARLFQPFVQADCTTTRNFGGAGLGLAITRRLAQLLGGDVNVQSEIGKGATFTLRVPAVLVAAEPEPANEPRSPAIADAA